jgi:aminopeptidase Y
MKLNSLVYTGLLAGGAIANEAITPDKVEADIQTDKLQNVLWNFNKIARDNGGNRAFGLPGYNASMDFVLERVRTRFGKYFDTTVQPFTHLFVATNFIGLTGPDGEDVRVATLMYNNPTALPGGATGELVAVPIDDVRGSGCFADQWEGIDPTGKIVLVKRGSCAISEKLRFAKDLGALAVVLINNVPGESIGAATLSAENVGKIAPVGVVTYEKGYEWFEAVSAGESLEVTLVVDAVAEDRQTWNIIAETKEGDPNSVIVLGAHLDSVQEGPGVNDDGSGSAALLELAGSIKKYKGFKNKVRFAWWGAEESGLVGSRYYGAQLTEAEADAIKFYFNYDMIGSPFPTYTVYADSDAHKTGGQILVDYITEKGFPAEYGGFGTSSDYVAFLELGIPSSGIFTGAGAPTDPCYHLACDGIDNINWDAITVNTRAAGRAMAQLALSVDGIPPREKTTVNPKSKRAIARDLTKWAGLANVVEKQHSCSGEEKSTV